MGKIYVLYERNAALKEICVSDRYIKIMEEMPKDFAPASEIAEKCIREED